jgi:phosphoribosylformylglycinamidine (FGAM) synthase-like amidotransferase family enzyme
VWFEQLNLILTVEGHTKENIDAWTKRMFDNAYAMGIYSLVNNIVFKDNILTLVRNGKNILIPGGFTYADPNAK